MSIQDGLDDPDAKKNKKQKTYIFG